VYEKIRSEEPFKANLEGDIWTVSGTLYRSDGKVDIGPAGDCNVKMSKDDARILFRLSIAGKRSWTDVFVARRSNLRTDLRDRSAQIGSHRRPADRRSSSSLLPSMADHPLSVSSVK
jgi:hypothetical protein